MNSADEAVVRLPDGNRLLLRPLWREDRELLLTGLRRMSARSRYLRFGSGALPDDDAVDDLLAVDGFDHVAIAAIVIGAPVAEHDHVEGDDRPHDLDGDGVDDVPDHEHGPRGPRAREGVGVGRFIRDTEDPTVAETALAVIDDWQGRGIATRLLERLVGEAHRVGVSTFRNYVMPENEEALALLRSIGANDPVHDGEVLIVDVPVPAADERLRETLAGRTLLAAAVDGLRFALRHPLLTLSEALSNAPATGTDDEGGGADADGSRTASSAADRADAVILR